MKSRLIILMGALLMLSDCSEPELTYVAYSDIDIADAWRETDLASVKLDKSLIDQAVLKASNIERMRSLVVVKNSHLVVEEYFDEVSENDLNDVRSITKSILGILTIMAVEQGLIASLDETIALPDYDLIDEQQEITYRHLLTMTSGFEWDEWTGDSYNEWWLSEDEIQALLDLPMQEVPGNVFTYNSASTHLLGRALEQKVGESLQSFAQKVLFDPLGISKVQWEMIDTGPNGGAGIDLRARDLARLGQLILQQGGSGELQLVSAQSTDQLVAPTTNMDWSYPAVSSFAYGMLWWVVDGPVESYLAWGYGGQFIVIIPAYHTVVVTTTNWRLLSQEGGLYQLTADVLDIIFNSIIPAVSEGQQGPA